ncbi:MAG TPA: peptidylprolyl isomerase [Flavobacteriales bacterium]|nr:peptidylprolyl isomerase [Flavobacteriales bacterium]
MKPLLSFVVLFLCAFAAPAQPDSTKKSKSEALMFSYQLYERIKKGESFVELAKKYSEDPGSAPNGGLYANINKGDFMKKFEEKLFSLKPGEISKPFKTSYGYHIAELVSVHGDKYDCRHILITYKE